MIVAGRRLLAAGHFRRRVSQRCSKGGGLEQEFYDERLRQLGAMGFWTGGYPSMADVLSGGTLAPLAELRRLALERLAPGQSLLASGASVANGTTADDLQQFVVAGRLQQKRKLSSKLVFYQLATDDDTLQIMSSAADWSPEQPTAFRQFHDGLRRGDVVAASGHLCRSNAGEASLCPRRMQLLSPCLHDVPVRLDDPHLRARQQYLAMRVAGERGDQRATLLRSLRARARLYAAVRGFLDQRGFVEVETPVLSHNVGGASAHPFVTQAREAYGRSAEPLYLRIAPELYLKQLIVGGIDRVYELGKQFRNEGVDASHNPEFTTLEFYQAYASVADLMPLTEQLLRVVVSAALGDDRPHYWHRAAPYARVSVVAELERRAGPRCLAAVFDRDAAALADAALSCGAVQPHELAAGCSLPKLVDRLVGHYVEPLTAAEPTFLVDLPLCLSPLARENPRLPGTAERFELFSHGVELVNAYTELNDPFEQRRRFQEQQHYRDASGDQETHTPDEPFCRALEYAMPPTAGWGMGLDRLLMQILDTQHIRDVIVAPRPVS